MPPDGPIENRIVLGPGEDAVARAVLVILRAIAVPQEEPTNDGWRFAPDQRVLSDRSATVYLSQVPKPVVCEVLRGKGEIEILCGRPEEHPRWQWWAEAMKDDAAWLGARERDEMDRTGNRCVLLVGETESIVLSETEAERLMQDYIILGDYTSTSFIASRLDLSLDVAVVWRYGHSTSSTSVEVVD